MDFSTEDARRSYSDRVADPGWLRWCEQHLNPAGRNVVEIGCGGGIYSRGFAALGAASVTGVDGSAQYVEEARAATEAGHNISFVHGTAAETGLEDRCADIVFSRALIHHLSGQEKLGGAIEMWRLLRPGGLCAVQDRTQEDVQSQDSDFWIRSALFEVFPQLLEFESARRPQRTAYVETLEAAGFSAVRVVHFSETRKRYTSFTELESEVMARKGKSILFELSDADLEKYCARLKEQAAGRLLEEVDPWTIWIGVL